MYYFVITQDGQKFGPVDIMTLNQWAAQGRILPHTILEESPSMRRIMAAQVAGLAIPNENAYRSPYQQSPSDYPRIVDNKADKMANTATALGVCGLFICPIFSLIGLVYGVMALQAGSMKAKRALIICVASLLLFVVGLAILQGMISSIGSGLGSVTSGIGSSHL